MTPEISIIIPAHNEGLEFLQTTVNSIRDTIDVSYEIIIVDDHSTPKLGPIEGVTVLRHELHRGVGQAFDTGVAEAKSDNIFLMGSDIRFIPNKWASMMIKEMDDHPKAFTCSICVGLNAPLNMDVAERAKRSRRNGARILFFHDHITHPKRPKGFKSILECQWLPVYKGASMDSFEVPAILGAAYGVKREWYRYVDGWWGHRSWGTLEPYISLKSWLMGGSCRTAPGIQTGHIFKSEGTHGTNLAHLSYNKILMATLLFPEKDAERLIAFLPAQEGIIKAGKKMIEDREEEINKKRDEYKEKIVLDIMDYVNRFEVDFRCGK